MTAERARAEATVLQEVERGELDVDDPVVAAVSHRGDRKL